MIPGLSVSGERIVQIAESNKRVILTATVSYVSVSIMVLDVRHHYGIFSSP